MAQEAAAIVATSKQSIQKWHLDLEVDPDSQAKRRFDITGGIP